MKIAIHVRFVDSQTNVFETPGHNHSDAEIFVKFWTAGAYGGERRVTTVYGG